MRRLLRRMLSPIVYARDDRGRRVAIRFSWLEACELDDRADAEPTEGSLIWSELFRSRPSRAHQNGVRRESQPRRSRTWHLLRGLWLIATPLVTVMVFGIVGVVALREILSHLATALRVSSITATVLVAATLVVVVPMYRLTLGKMFRAEEAPRLIGAALRRLRCGGCGYSLREVRAEEDGCRCCPECGAAWQVETWAQRERERV